MQIKNKKANFIYYLLAFFLLNFNLSAEEFNITAKEILIDKENEILVGILNGTIFRMLCGVLISLTAEVLLNSDPLLGLVLGTGIILAVSLASLLGSLTPIVFINLDIDPAISTGPIIRVVNDILGLAIYLITAKIILGVF